VSRITEQAVRKLAGMKGNKAPVTSCYLDVDGRRYPRQSDYEQSLARLVRRARSQPRDRAPAPADLARIEEHVRAGVDRSRVRGLALFSCAADGFFEAVELPVPVHNLIVVNHTPYVRPLETLLDEYERFGVLLVDKQRFRLLVFELGELTDKREFVDRLPRHDDDGGEWDRDHVRDHREVAVQQHLRRAAAAAFALWQAKGFDRLMLGAPAEIAAEAERCLHAYLRDRLVGRLAVPTTASDEEIRAAALALAEQVEREREAAAVARLRDAVGSGNGGVAGLEPVLGALVARRVDTLFVSDGYVAEGWRCGGCGHLAVLGPSCPVCGARMARVDDVVEEAIEDALLQNCRVEVCVGNPDLDVMGRIGALLRY
jgi:peptide chain release factor subunit 1